MSEELAFSMDFKVKVLGLMFQKPEFLEAVAPVLKPEHFGNRIDETLAEMILDFHKEYPRAAFTKTVFVEEFKKLLSKGIIPVEEQAAYVERFAKVVAPVPDAEYIKKNLEKFLIHVSMDSALEDAVTLHAKGKYDEIVDIVGKARSCVRGTTTVEDAVLTERVESFLTRLKDPADLGSRKGFGTGIADLDEVLFFHGMDTKEMFVYCGPPGRGKSIAMLNQGIAGILQGIDVLYYTLEVSTKVYEMRFHACLTGIPAVQLAPEADEVGRRWERIRDVYPKMGNLVLRDLPSRILRPSMIRRDIQYYRERGRDIKMVVVDYADIMASDKKLKLEDKRLEYGDIYEELRSIAKEFDVAIITASQGNRASLNKKEIDMDSMSEDFSKAFTADYVVGICQTKAEAMKRTTSGDCTSGVMRLFLAKNRNETRGENIELWTDYARMRMSYEDWGWFDEKVYGIGYREP